MSQHFDWITLQRLPIHIPKQGADYVFMRFYARENDTMAVEIPVLYVDAVVMRLTGDYSSVEQKAREQYRMVHPIKCDVCLSGYDLLCFPDGSRNHFHLCQRCNEVRIEDIQRSVATNDVRKWISYQHAKRIGGPFSW